MYVVRPCHCTVYIGTDGSRHLCSGTQPWLPVLLYKCTGCPNISVLYTVHTAHITLYTVHTAWYYYCPTDPSLSEYSQALVPCPGAHWETIIRPMTHNSPLTGSISQLLCVYSYVLMVGFLWIIIAN